MPAHVKALLKCEYEHGIENENQAHNKMKRQAITTQRWWKVLCVESIEKWTHTYVYM